MTEAVVTLWPCSVRLTAPPAPPPPPLPPIATPANSPTDPELPPLPPPPPTDCAKMPVESAPSVVILPPCRTVTVELVPPPAPLPPTATMPPELPPSPPPPPMLCATMPRDAVFVVTMLPKFSTVTAPPLPALAPLPPMATRPPAFEPLPPLPPTDCAKMASDCTPVVVMLPVLLLRTVTVLALPPFDPDPPSAIRPPALPPVPPPPPMLCAKMPRDCAPVVVIDPLLFTVTVPPLPPLSGLPLSETRRFPEVPDEPPDPPMLCARIPCASVPDVKIEPVVPLFTVTGPPLPPKPPLPDCPTRPHCEPPSPPLLLTLKA